MASRRFFDFAPESSSPPGTNNSPYRSWQSLNGTESPIFHSPRSLSPEDDIIRRENTEAPENTPLIADENHYGTAAEQNEFSMSLVFRGSSSSLELEDIPVWKRIRSGTFEFYLFHK